jgi:drug/metabolite transporter (DMT)-like permease
MAIGADFVLPCETDSSPMTDARDRRDLTIWWFAFGYFAAYVPYTFLVKGVTQYPKLPGMDGVVGEFEVLPVSVFASLIGMLLFISAMRWWPYAGHRRVAGVSIAWPNRWTFLSGLCTAVVIATTTLAYTMKPSIVFMMLLMRGGLLVMAPLVDAISGRHVRWFSWAAFALSLAALLVAFGKDLRWVDGRPSFAGLTLTAVALANVGAYLGAYFVRLRFMSRLAKSDDPRASTGYFVEEQMVATPALLLALVIVALADGASPWMQQVRAGFTQVADQPALPWIILIGVCSQGTGVFGSLILLDRRENTFCVPVNRSSSVIAGVLATLLLWGLLGAPKPSLFELAGAGLIIGAIAVLTLGPLRERRRTG